MAGRVKGSRDARLCHWLSISRPRRAVRQAGPGAAGSGSEDEASHPRRPSPGPVRSRAVRGRHWEGTGRRGQGSPQRQGSRAGEAGRGPRGRLPSQGWSLRHSYGGRGAGAGPGQPGKAAEAASQDRAPVRPARGGQATGVWARQGALSLRDKLEGAQRPSDVFSSDLSSRKRPEGTVTRRSLSGLARRLYTNPQGGDRVSTDTARASGPGAGSGSGFAGHAAPTTVLSSARARPPPQSCAWPRADGVACAHRRANST